MTGREFHNNVRSLSEITDCVRDPLDDLEWYYNQLYDMNCTNCESYEIDMEWTRKRIEAILFNSKISKEDMNFIESILPDIEEESVERAERLREYLNEL